MNAQVRAQKSRKFLEDPAFEKVTSTEAHRRTIHDATLASFGFVKGYEEGAKDERSDIYKHLYRELDILSVLADNESINNKGTVRDQIHGHIRDRILKLMEELKA